VRQRQELRRVFAKRPHRIGHRALAHEAQVEALSVLADQQRQPDVAEMLDQPGVP